MSDNKTTLICAECGAVTEESHYREDENETVCEDCWVEYIAFMLGAK